MCSNLVTAFQQLDAVLTDTQPLWQPQPFISNDLPWRHTHTQLWRALLAIDENEARDLHDNQQQRIAWFQRWEPALCDALYAFEPPPAASATELILTPFDKVDIPGRKWDQIIAFASALSANSLPLVDWCAGKGHLSRVVQRSQHQTVHCLEWDSALVEAGSALAAKQRLDIHYHHHDVTQAPPTACADAAKVHIGLHACGELHAHLLRHVTTSSAQAVALSPCCYHKIPTEHYQPLSNAAKHSSLLLSRSALQLSVQGAVTARRGERRRREQERQWRLGFDALQRDVRACNDYLSVPSCKVSQLRQGFHHFCQWAADTRQLSLPTTVDYERYLQLGREKYQQVYRLELLRRLFTRPLELWLILDRALYLEENGYRVRVSQFCESSVSPRNLLIQGQRA